VKVHEIKSKHLPELDDEFAQDADDEVETLDALKEKIKQNLKHSKEHAAKHAIEDAVVMKAAENAEIDIPEAMVNTEVNRMMQEFEQNLSQQGLNLDLYYQFSGQKESDLRDQMKEDAEKRVRYSLTLEAIADAENLEVSDEEVEAELANMSEMYKMSVEDIKRALGSLEGIQSDLKTRKAIEFLVQNSKTIA
jgi:trigger factor